MAALGVAKWDAPLSSIIRSWPPSRIGEGGGHLPAGVETLQHAVVRAHDFAHLLLVALGQRVAAQRQDLALLEKPAQALLVFHESRPIVGREKARIAGDAKTIEALGQRARF